MLIIKPFPHHHDPAFIHLEKMKPFCKKEKDAIRMKQEKTTDEPGLNICTFRNSVNRI